MKFAAIIGISAVVLTAATPAMASHKSWEDASTIGRDILVGAGLGVPAVQGDWTGDLQSGASMLVAGGASYGLKEIFPERRPDGSDNKSFPSGHAAISFAAAASLENRYGWKVGFPAFALASFVSVARVEARKHHWYDVVAGGALGTTSGFLITSRRNDSVRLTPWADSGGGGVAFAMKF